MRPPLAARTRIAFGLVLTAILALSAAIHVRYRRSADPDQPTARTATGRAPDRPGGDAIAGRPRDIAPGTLRLEGTAVDDRWRPIGGARITLDGARTTTSEGDGSFAFDGLAPGDYELTAEKAAAYGEQAVSLDEHAGPRKLQLHVGPTLVVHVVDRDRAPLAGARVTTIGRLDRLTDRDGKVTLRGEAGSVYIGVHAPGYASSELHVALGEDPRDTVDRTVVLGPTASIGGTVIDRDGAPVPGANVIVREADDSWSDNTQADDQGRWQLDNFGAGKLRLTAYSDAAFPTPGPLVEFDATVPRLDLVIRMDRGGTIGGVAVDPDGRPVAGARVFASTSAPASSALGFTDERGRFSIAGIPPGEVTVEASADALFAPTRTVQLRRAGHAALTLHLVETGIEGTVTNLHGEPVANATVIAHPGYSQDSTDAAGHFALRNLAPGNDALSVTRESASDRGLGLADNHAVTVHSGDHHVALVLPDAGRITGRVVLDGHPVTFFGVAADPKLTPEPQYVPDGRFTLEVQTSTEWPEQRYLVFVGPGFQRLILDSGVFAGSEQTTDLGDIAVTAGKTVRGRVVDASGAPVIGAAVVVQPGGELETELSLSKQNAGSRGAHSDASGRFEIAGLPDDLSELQIQAQHPDLGQALPRALTAADLGGDVELVLAPTGAVSGSVIGDGPGDFREVRAVSRADGRLYVTYAMDGAFWFAQLPAGDYTASLGGESALPAVPFRVSAHRTAAFSLTRPAVPPGRQRR